MDELTRSYLRKTNLKIQDKFETEISHEDIYELEKARAWVFGLPLMFLTGFHIIMWVKNSGGFASWFVKRITTLRMGSSGTPAQNKQWDSVSKKFIDKGVVVDPVNNPHHGLYDGVDEARKENEAKQPKVFVRPVKRNLDPFERKRRLAMG